MHWLLSRRRLSRSQGSERLRVAGLFAGIGGLEHGLHSAGHRAVSLCESWEPARAVLGVRFPDLAVDADVRQAANLPEVDLLSAGFPCTDISQAGAMAGIGGAASGLVMEVFRLAKEGAVPWLLLENVPNLLTLHRGAGMRLITEAMEGLGYKWAYRVVDSRFTGVPQRRLRVLLLAHVGSPPPEDVLLSEDQGPVDEAHYREDAFGFYWTEGRGGLGWARDAIPTLKGGSTVGIPSAPAVWLPHAERGAKLLMPSLIDGERLQGFTPGWTEPARGVGGRDHRWKLVGNAVTVGVAAWLGERLNDPVPFQPEARQLLDRSARWPSAGWGGPGEAWTAEVTAWPRRADYQHLTDFLNLDEAKPLSHRAARGFLGRLDESGLKVDRRFLADVEEHVRHTRPRMVSSPSADQRLPEGSTASSPEARRRMQANRGRDTGPEIRLRQALHALGLRYRLHCRPEPDIRTRVDIVFRPAKVAVEVRGCFWHACPTHGTQPKANSEAWAAKLRRNQERDAKVEQRLKQAGWFLAVVWEHEDPKEAAVRIADIVAQRRTA
jgi:DNA (cytosine-5)-methyltransferase 1